MNKQDGHLGGKGEVCRPASVCHQASQEEATTSQGGRAASGMRLLQGGMWPREALSTWASYFWSLQGLREAEKEPLQRS